VLGPSWIDWNPAAASEHKVLEPSHHHPTNQMECLAPPFKAAASNFPAAFSASGSE
jgi:hypothetical protein